MCGFNAGAKHHDDHHRYLRYNYQPFLTYLDDFMGTTLPEGRTVLGTRKDFAIATTREDAMNKVKGA